MGRCSRMPQMKKQTSSTFRVSLAAGGAGPAVQGAQQQPQRRQQQRQNAAQEDLWHGRQLLSDQINIRGPSP